MLVEDLAWVLHLIAARVRRNYIGHNSHFKSGRPLGECRGSGGGACRWHARVQEGGEPRAPPWGKLERAHALRETGMAKTHSRTLSSVSPAHSGALGVRTRPSDCDLALHGSPSAACCPRQHRISRPAHNDDRHLPARIDGRRGPGGRSAAMPLIWAPGGRGRAGCCQCRRWAHPAQARQLDDVDLAVLSACQRSR